MGKKLNPQGYIITKDPVNGNPFWGGQDVVYTGDLGFTHTTYQILSYIKQPDATFVDDPGAYWIGNAPAMRLNGGGNTLPPLGSTDTDALIRYRLYYSTMTIKPQYRQAFYTYYKHLEDQYINVDVLNRTLTIAGYKIQDEKYNIPFWASGKYNEDILNEMLGAITVPDDVQMDYNFYRASSNFADYPQFLVMKPYISGEISGGTYYINGLPQIIKKGVEPWT